MEQRRYTKIIVAAAIVTCFARCDETGIVIEISHSADSNVGLVDQLRLFVGSQNDDGPGFSSLVNDGDEVISFDPPRDLQADPYRLLLREGEVTASQFVVVAVARNNAETKTAVGRVPQSISFRDGKVLQWDLAVAPLPCETADVPADWLANLIALYTFDNIEGTVVPDIVGNHDGQFVNGPPALENGPDGCGQALRFRAGQDPDLPVAHVAIADHPNWQLDQGSIDFRVQMGPFRANQLQGIISRDAVRVDFPGHFTVHRLCGNYISVRLQQVDTLDDPLVCSEIELPTGSWSHVVVNFGGTDAPELFVDGVRQNGGVVEGCFASQFCGQATVGGSIRGNANPWVFGASSTFSNEGATEELRDPFDGVLDNVRISATHWRF